MWDWSRTVAERAWAAAWQSVRGGEPEPTIRDPEPWAAHQAEAGEEDVGRPSEYRLIG